MHRQMERLPQLIIVQTVATLHDLEPIKLTRQSDNNIEAYLKTKWIVQAHEVNNIERWTTCPSVDRKATIGLQQMGNRKGT